MKKLNIQNIVVPIDFSKMSIQGIETAKCLAHRFGAAIHLAHVHQFDYPTHFTAPMPPLIPFSVVTFEQDAEKRLARQLKTLANKEGLSSAACHLLSGAPAFDEICRLAWEIPVDLVVTPTHGHTGLKHFFWAAQQSESCSTRLVPSLWCEKKSDRRKPDQGSRLTQSLCR